MSAELHAQPGYRTRHRISSQETANAGVSQDAIAYALAKAFPDDGHFWIPSHIEGLSLFLRYLPAQTRSAGAPKIVLYVHGGTFPSALTIAHRFDGRSWRDELCARGFDLWGLDFLGFGASDQYPEMVEPAEPPAVGPGR